MGPEHPSTHGVLRMIMILCGEMLGGCGSVELGLLHRGAEKLMECNNDVSGVCYMDRMDYVSTIVQELLYVCGLERLMSGNGVCYVSVWRVILVEYYRILNNMLGLTTHAIDMGLLSVMLWGFEERERLIMMLEVLCGARVHGAFLLVGRLRYDISIR